MWVPSLHGSLSYPILLLLLLHGAGPPVLSPHLLTRPLALHVLSSLCTICPIPCTIKPDFCRTYVFGVTTSITQAGSAPVLEACMRPLTPGPQRTCPLLHQMCRCPTAGGTVPNKHSMSPEQCAHRITCNQVPRSLPASLPARLPHGVVEPGVLSRNDTAWAGHAIRLVKCLLKRWAPAADRSSGSSWTALPQIGLPATAARSYCLLRCCQGACCVPGSGWQGSNLVTTSLARTADKSDGIIGRGLLQVQWVGEQAGQVAGGSPGGLGAASVRRHHRWVCCAPAHYQ